MYRQILFLCLFVGLTLAVNAQNTLIKGTVTDSVTGETLPYVSLILKGTTTGTTTDDNGNFSLSSSANVRTLHVSYLGYTAKELTVTLGRTNTLKIQLAPSSINLTEVVVKPGRERYSRRDNPAVDFIRSAINVRESNDPRNHDYFSYNQYEKMIFAMNDYEPKHRKEGEKAGKFDFLDNYIDTLELGKTILPVSEKERLETVYFRKDPRSEKRFVRAQKSAGVDEIFSRDGIQQLLGEVFKEVNIFRNEIPLFLQRFVSPMSTMGPTFYKYYLLDTLNINGAPCVDLGFVPFNAESFGFTGHLYITLDSTYFVQRVRLNVAKNININFVSGIIIDQDFARTDDGTRLLLKDDIQVEFKLNEKTKGMYARRMNIFSDHSFREPEEKDIFKESAPVLTALDANKKSEDFWQENRPEEGVKRNPNTVEKLMEQLRSVPIFYATEKIVSLFVNGYVQTSPEKHKSMFEIGPVNTFFSPNNIEGGRFRVGGTTTTNFSKRLFLEGLVAYGTKDEKVKYDALIEYSFNDKTDYRREFPVHSIRLQHGYDINQIGQQYMFTNKDNIFLAWKRQKDNRATYLRYTELAYNNELYNGLSFGATLRHKRENSTEYALFDRIEPDGTTRQMDHYQMSEAEFRIRYAPNEKYFQTRNYRYPITLDAPVLTLTHSIAAKGFLGSSYSYNRTDFSIMKRFWLPMSFGYMDIVGRAGKVWDQAPYPLMILPNANLSYGIQPESYALMNAMEFINDEFVSWDFSYFMNGALFNRLPLLKKLKIREVFTFRGMYGNLTDKNNPFLTDADGKLKNDGLYLFPEGSMLMGHRPYMEAGVGIENIFSFLRLDYVWRITYKDNPNIDKRGIRFMFRLSF